MGSNLSLLGNNLLSLGRNLFCVKSYIDNGIEKLIYHPPQIPADDYPRILNNRNSTLAECTTRNGNKVSLVCVKPNYNINPDKWIIHSHGNASDILLMYPYFQRLANDLNVGVYGYDYIGYGVSESLKPTEELCYESIEAVVHYLSDTCEIDSKKIFLIGQSLGTGVVVDYASKNNWTTPIILISPYKSICKVVANTICTKPIDKFESQSKLENLKCPVKIFHGIKDQIIDITHGIDMYNSLNDKSLDPVWFEQTGHCDILGKITKKQYLEVIEYRLI